jgi:hypothetical protein
LLNTYNVNLKISALVDSKAVTADEDDKKNGNPSSTHHPIEGSCMY